MSVGAESRRGVGEVPVDPLQAAGSAVILGIALYAIVMAVLTGWVAQEKGRSYAGWALAGILLGLLALVAVGLAPERRTGRGWIVCGACLEPMRDGATTCPHCQTEIVYP